MQRRGFLQAAGIVGAGTVVSATALAQPRGRAGLRAEWSATGPADGHEPADPTAPSAEERIHVPVLTLPRATRAGRAFDLVVQVGMDPHPMQPDHRIDWVEVRIGETRAWVIDLSAGVPYPIVRVPIALAAAAPLTVRARC